jgi:hypothetical protein
MARLDWEGGRRTLVIRLVLSCGSVEYSNGSDPPSVRCPPRLASVETSSRAPLLRSHISSVGDGAQAFWADTAQTAQESGVRYSSVGNVDTLSWRRRQDQE